MLILKACIEYIVNSKEMIRELTKNWTGKQNPILSKNTIKSNQFPWSCPVSVEQGRIETHRENGTSNIGLCLEPTLILILHVFQRRSSTGHGAVLCVCVWRYVRET